MAAIPVPAGPGRRSACIRSPLRQKKIPSMPCSGIGGTSLVCGQPFSGNVVFPPAGEVQLILGKERSEAKWKAAKKFSEILPVFPVC